MHGRPILNGFGGQSARKKKRCSKRVFLNMFVLNFDSRAFSITTLWVTWDYFWTSRNGKTLKLSMRCSLALLTVTTLQVQSCFTSTETLRIIRDGEPRTATSTFTQLLSSELRHYVTAFFSGVTLTFQQNRTAVAEQHSNFRRLLDYLRHCSPRCNTETRTKKATTFSTC